VCVCVKKDTYTCVYVCVCVKKDMCGCVGAWVRGCVEVKVCGRVGAFMCMHVCVREKERERGTERQRKDLC